MDSSPLRPTHTNRPACPFIVGQDFDTVKALRDACHDFAVKDGFEFKPKSSKSIYTIICKGENCTWRLYASAIDGTDRFRIRTLNPDHTCFSINHAGNKQATQAMIASRIAEKLKDQPNYRPSDIVLDIKRELGVEITYSKALRSRDAALELNSGTHEDAYKNLPQYCEDLEATDPNTKALVERTHENKFRRMFLCHGACATGFAYCRPLLGLDGTHLSSKYKGILLAATATDANGQLFPLAYGVVSKENDDNWLWFLRLLHEIIQVSAPEFLTQQQPEDRLVFLSDRQKGLLEGVERIFPNSHHGFCMKHLEENFHKKFKNVELKPLLWQAARALTKEEFDTALENMTKINPRTVPWLYEHANPAHWAELYFPGRRYGHLTSNIAESLNSKLLPARQMPILGLLESIRSTLMDWFSQKRQLEANTSGLVVKKVATQIQDIKIFQATRYRMKHRIDKQYEIKSNRTLQDYLVDLNKQTCSCRKWQATGIPCSHAIGVIVNSLKADPQTYVKAFYTLDAFNKTYAKPIMHPNSNIDYSRPLNLNSRTDDIDTNVSDNELGSELEPSMDSEDVLLAPNTTRGVGRPPNKRKRPTATAPEKRRIQRCGRCNATGHSKRTCAEKI